VHKETSPLMGERRVRVKSMEKTKPALSAANVVRGNNFSAYYLKDKL
jgi:hypothetical protein